MRVFCFLLISLLSNAAWAHPGHAGGGWPAGFLHPFTGLDHLLAMVAVGFWAAQIGGHARWAVPFAFVAAMLAGAAAGFAGAQVPFVEPVVAASVVALGLLVAFGLRPSLWAGAAVCGAFAVFHGMAHAADWPQGAGVAEYVVGFAAATVLLHALGVLVGQRYGGLRLARWAGVPVAIAGCAILGQALASVSF